MRSNIHLSTLLVLSGALFLAACGSSSDGSAAADAGDADDARLGPVVEAQIGALEGAWVDAAEDVLVFRGVPYAQPPVGDARWRPPVPVESWDGARSARSFEAPCWQRPREYNSIYTRGDLSPSEDCLYLNIWTSAESPTSGLPVMVWFHGGGHNSGTGSARIFDRDGAGPSGRRPRHDQLSPRSVRVSGAPGLDRRIGAWLVWQLRAP